MINRKLLISALILITCLIYGRTVTFDFVDMDDRTHILENPHIKDESGSFLDIWKKPYFNLYVPVTYSVWAVVAKVAKKQEGSAVTLSAAPFHLLNVLLHIGNVLLIFLLLQILFEHQLGAFFGALLFAVHPLQVETVAWVSCLRDLLAAFLSLGALLLLARLKTELKSLSLRELVKERHFQYNYFFALILYVLALLAKPSAVALCLVLPLFLIWHFKRSIKEAILFTLPWAVISCIQIIATSSQQQFGPLDFVTPLHLRPVIALDALSFYLYKFLAPLSLVPDYSRSPETILKTNLVWVTAIAPVLLAFLLIRVKKARFMLPPLGIFLMALLPVLGFMPFYFQSISTVADRYMYFPMLGFALLVGESSKRLAQKQLNLFAGVASLLAILSMLQTSHWQDSMSLFTYGTDVNPKSWFMQHNLGEAFHRQNQLEKAVAQYQKSVTIRPIYADGRYNLAMAYRALRSFDLALRELREAKKVKPDDFDINIMEAVILEESGQPDAAIDLLRRMWITFLNSPHAPTVRFQLAKTLASHSQMDEAIKRYKEVLELDPLHAETHHNLGIIYAEKRHHHLAIQHLEKAIESSPRFALAHFNLGLVYLNTNSPEKAASQFKKTMALDPSFTDANAYLEKALSLMGRSIAH